MREIKQIIIHCSATSPDLDLGAADIKRWHVEQNGWQDIGYHYVIRRNGGIELGRDLDGDGDVLEEVGAHTYGFNQHSVGICLIGGVGETNQPEANFSFIQYQSLHLIVQGLTRMFPEAEILGHRDLPNTTKACPSFNVKAFFNRQN